MYLAIKHIVSVFLPLSRKYFNIYGMNLFHPFNFGISRVRMSQIRS